MCSNKLQSLVDDTVLSDRTSKRRVKPFVNKINVLIRTKGLGFGLLLHKFELFCARSIHVLINEMHSKFGLIFQSCFENYMKLTDVQDQIILAGYHL